jgi:membrane associated rhomboid family serine protease
MKQIWFLLIIFTSVLAAIYTAIFFIFPQLALGWAFIPAKVLSGEGWRIFTYQWVHLNNAHLFENVVTVVLLGVISTELRTEWTDFLLVYFVSGTLAILPILLLSQFTALGASTAIYGGFGLISQELVKFKIKPIYVIAGITLLIFFRTIIQLVNCGLCDESIFLLRQSGAHFSGMLMGIGVHKLIYAPLNVKLGGILHGSSKTS